MSPFHAGGGGGGGGAASGAGGGAAATQLFDPGSKTVPAPHSAAWLVPGDITVTNAIVASAIPAIVINC
jgi:hypothetical protein